MFRIACFALGLLGLFAGSADAVQEPPGCAVAVVVTGNGGDQTVDACTVTKLPKVWIGVRVSSVPKALASHLDREGLMIADVAEDSPADRAGLQRYDVVVSFNGKSIDGMDDLLNAIGEAGADNQVPMVVIRASQEQTLEIAPIKREAAAAPKFKYAEEEAEDVSLSAKYFGHRLKTGPHGPWIFESLGRMHHLPDDLEDLLDDIPDTDWKEWSDQWPHLPGLPFGMKIEIDTDDLGHGRLLFDAWDEADAEVEIRIKIVEDGESITIERSSDGTIEVERVDADGNRSSATYEDADQLREEDPEAYKTYRRFSGYRTGAMILQAPRLDRLKDAQREYQIKIEGRLGKVRECVQRALEDAERAARRARIQIETRSAKDVEEQDVTVEKKVVMLRLDDDGRITLTIVDDGQKLKYEFESREDFQAQEPELYERYKEHLDQAAP